MDDRKMHKKSRAGRTDGFAQRKMGFSGAEGVIVPDEATLKKLQHVLRDMLKDFQRVAAKEHIVYTMSGGSVLGSIRHQGFIPWDDDVDINIPRKDFEKLKAVFDDCLGDKYELCTPERTPGHGMALVQMKKKGTVCRSYNELSKENPGIAIDFFILENVFDSPVLKVLQGGACLAAGYLLSCRKTWHDMPYLEPYFDSAPGLREMFSGKARVGSLIRWIPLDLLARLTHSVYTMCRDPHTKYVAIPSGRKHFFGECYLRKDACRRFPGDFEGLKVPIPVGYKAYMEVLYGPDYMVVPPPEKREVHPLMELDFGEDKS